MEKKQPSSSFTSFAGQKLIVSGSLKTMLLRTKKYLERGKPESVLIFDDQTGAQLDFDFRGTPDEVWERLSRHPYFAGTAAGAAAGVVAESPTKSTLTPAAGPGRPKLGVVCREVSLLPRHWAWLELQPNGISAALRRLIDEARKREPGKEQARIAWEAAGKFMWVMAGNLAGYEEASRALFAKDQATLKKLISKWPEDVRKHAWRLVQRAISLEGSQEEKAGG